MTILVLGYKTKKELKHSKGQRLRYRETSLHGTEYQANGTFAVAHRPAVTGGPGREFFATVTMVDNRIDRVEC